MEVGCIGDAWGILGSFKVQPYNVSSDVLFSTHEWWVQAGERGRKLFKGTGLLRVHDVKRHGDVLLASAHDVPDRTTAEALKGVRVFVPRSVFPGLPENEYYWVDLIGLEVVNREGVHLGRVSNLLSPGPQEILVINSEQADKAGVIRPFKRLIPFVSMYIDSVDLAARRITVDWQLDYDQNS